MNEILRDQTYLGDGVYAGHDGYQIWLSTERDGREHLIALEPAVLRALIRYEEMLRDKYDTALFKAATSGPGHDVD